MNGAPIRLSVTYDAPISRVWSELRQLDRHVLWMNDAERIEFTTDGPFGLGTSFFCHTRIGPLHTVDKMTVTSWTDGEEITVRHEGIVTGEGTFRLSPVGAQTKLDWSETLRFPWWGLGSFGARLATPILKIVWKKNLSNLGDLIAKPQ